MKKKKLKAKLKALELRIRATEQNVTRCYHCENYKPKTVEFKRYRPLPPITYPEEIYKAEVLHERETSGKAGGEED